ncbi:MAG: large subunit ribosomal protein L11 [Candidatus Berkelbacteria bacterium Licking1014_7]|uniref:Large ribosomal subunit protein uL11 n=1 Tax=Candidatus Berkelbacteria bacterium Licking1014_7 TaxID=2017147 RepID=A0A554LHX0_9BACT|nr:MAG: large subunit ribosomal protein L11 [Candidatus Berkelbacteria bacterium Licking1014_7]
MAKKVKTIIKLQILGGQANPAPPVGPALGQHGLNIGDFTQKFNEATKEKNGVLLPVEITVFEDRTFDFKIKTPPASYLIKKAAKIEKGSGEAGRGAKIASITKKQVEEIAQEKMEDLNVANLDAASKIIEGTARSMGVEVK